MHSIQILKDRYILSYISSPVLSKFDEIEEWSRFSHRLHSSISISQAIWQESYLVEFLEDLSCTQ